MKKEVWHLTEGLLFVHFAVFFMTSTGQGDSRALALIPGTVHLRPWTLVTFQFIHTGMISFFFSMLILWIMARPLEIQWGSPRFFLFWLVSISGAAGTALLLGIPLAGDIFMATSLLFTYATIYPDTEFLIFFILPVKVKYLAVIGGAFLAFQGFGFGLLRGGAYVVGMSTGFVFFLLTRRLPTARQLQFEIKKRSAGREIKVEGSKARLRNHAWDPAVRRAEEESRAAGRIPAGLEPLVEELEASIDPSVTICSPEDFHHIDDPVCEQCPGYPTCALRSIRAAAGEPPEEDSEKSEKA